MTTRTIRAPRLPFGVEVGSEIDTGGELARVLSITYEDRCVVIEVEVIE